jgi:hypothetical protein
LRLKGFRGGTKVIKARICPEALQAIKETMKGNHRQNVLRKIMIDKEAEIAYKKQTKKPRRGYL